MYHITNWNERPNHTKKTSNQIRIIKKIIVASENSSGSSECFPIHHFLHSIMFRRTASWWKVNLDVFHINFLLHHPLFSNLKLPHPTLNGTLSWKAFAEFVLGLLYFHYAIRFFVSEQKQTFSKRYKRKTSRKNSLPYRWNVNKHLKELYWNIAKQHSWLWLLIRPAKPKTKIFSWKLSKLIRNNPTSSFILAALAPKMPLAMIVLWLLRIWRTLHLNCSEMRLMLLLRQWCRHSLKKAKQ